MGNNKMRKTAEQELRKRFSQFVCRFLSGVCEMLIKGVLAFFAYLEYATAIRVFIISNYGLYWTGLIDGSIVATTLVATILYVYVRLHTSLYN